MRLAYFTEVRGVRYKEVTKSCVREPSAMLDRRAKSELTACKVGALYKDEDMLDNVPCT